LQKDIWGFLEMDKKEKFLSLLSKIEPRIDKYLKYIDSKIIRAFVVREKAFLKVLAILMKNVLDIDFKKKIKTFWERDLYVYLADSDASALYFFGTLYGDEIKIIKFLIKNFKENDIFYDVGANYGFYTCLAQEFIIDGEIHAFEPNPKIFRLLKENARLDIFKNTFLNEVALSDKTGETEFFDREISRHSGSSSLIKHQHFLKYKVIKVKTATLDDYISNHKPPTIMKIDVERGEPLVLKGGLGLIKKYNPTIIMEFFPDDLHREAVNILFNSGYRAFKVDNDGNLSIVNEQNLLRDDVPHEANYVFKRIEKT
jgi:FkbM family methyltransferase